MCTLIHACTKTLSEIQAFGGDAAGNLFRNCKHTHLEQIRTRCNLRISIFYSDENFQLSYSYVISLTLGCNLSRSVSIPLLGQSLLYSTTRLLYLYFYFEPWHSFTHSEMFILLLQNKILSIFFILKFFLNTKAISLAIHFFLLYKSNG